MGLPEAPAGVISGAGAGEGFEAFYVREYHAVVRLAYALSGSRLAAEDIAQEAFLRAFRDWEQIRSPSQVIALRYVAVASVAEMARTLGMAEGTVKAQLYRGPHALATRLAAPWEDDHV